MPIKISALPNLTTADAADQLPIQDVSASTTKKMTLTVLKEWFQTLVGWISTAMLADSSVTPVKYTNPYKFSAYRNGAWTPSTTAAKVPINAEEFDTNNNFDSTTNYRYTVPVTGYYLVMGKVGNANATTQGRVVSIYKNGATIETLYSEQISVSSGGWVTGGLGGSCMVYLTAGDYIELWALLNPAGAGAQGSSKSTAFSACLLSQT